MDCEFKKQEQKGPLSRVRLLKMFSAIKQDVAELLLKRVAISVVMAGLDPEGHETL